MEKDLTLAQKKARDILHKPEFIFDDPTNSSNGFLYDINGTLKETGRKPERLPSKLEIKNSNGDTIGFQEDKKLLARIDKYIENMEVIRKTFEYLSGKIANRKYFYTEMNVSDLGYKETYFLKQNDQLDYDKIETDLADIFLDKYGLVQEYMAVKTFYKEETSNPEGRILLRLDVPKGTNILPIDNKTIYLKRRSAFQVTGLSEIVSHGQSALLIDVAYFDEVNNSDEILNAEIDIQNSEDIANNLYAPCFGVSTGKKYLNLEWLINLLLVLQNMQRKHY
ncbi:hypothetical protein BHL53_14480 [Bacillus cereus]|uniref:hypothetical protein n=1 Tax=Bacillus cereus TaxID=1396 RepID=UPI0009950AD8|nr:hypothetical protein [Bacillus cereus]OPA24210.1 hypothetical protein BHL53_14480 [Bacillus cereus]